ncbi:hypothetical protein SCLCIDRAFT_33504 [Scleroderma citrinum Foug A]|uniref:Carbohydrate-binding module family 13 protein n=1 Tax=Scleroderma citrinum Foug A TaxID=1036808 RepID=A0A0C3D5H1_9AGAM|nr:hypothetical protein SCLCIDRAFT_33504 [Scleroderma citrinum Foug A]
MSDPCGLKPGYYYITNRYDQCVGACHSKIVVKGEKTRFCVKKIQGPTCLYQITLDNDYIQHNGSLVNAGHINQLWVIEQWGQVYSVKEAGTDLAWTDPGSAGNPVSHDRQLYLSSLNAALPQQQFKFNKV